MTFCIAVMSLEGPAINGVPLSTLAWHPFLQPLAVWLPATTDILYRRDKNHIVVRAIWPFKITSVLQCNPFCVISPNAINTIQEVVMDSNNYKTNHLL